MVEEAWLLSRIDLSGFFPAWSVFWIVIAASGAQVCLFSAQTLSLMFDLISPKSVPICFGVTRGTNTLKTDAHILIVDEDKGIRELL